MKPRPRKNYDIIVWHQIKEEVENLAHFYQGIYSVRLNYTVDVMFVPEFRKQIKSLPPEIPENTDNISSSLEAKLVTICFSNINITPDDDLSGQVETFYTKLGNEKIKRTLFYVKHKEYETFQTELETVSDRIIGIRDGIQLSELKDLNFIKYIEATIISPAYLSEHHLEMLGRDEFISKS